MEFIFGIGSFLAAVGVVILQRVLANSKPSIDVLVKKLQSAITDGRISNDEVKDLVASAVHLLIINPEEFVAFFKSTLKKYKL